MKIGKRGMRKDYMESPLPWPKKEKQLDILSDTEAKQRAFVSDFINMLDGHKKRMHNDGSKPCVMCRSLRRHILGGLGK